VVGVRAEDRAQQALEVRAPVVVGADGRHSVVAERLGCRRPHALRRCQTALAAAPPTRQS